MCPCSHPCLHVSCCLRLQAAVELVRGFTQKGGSPLSDGLKEALQYIVDIAVTTDDHQVGVFYWPLLDCFVLCTSRRPAQDWGVIAGSISHLP
jgi:hypothetical protein